MKDNEMKRVWDTAISKCLSILKNKKGIYVQGCDFSQVHSQSVFTEEEKDILRQYGAIFNEEDQTRSLDTMKQF